MPEQAQKTRQAREREAEREAEQEPAGRTGEQQDLIDQASELEAEIDALVDEEAEARAAYEASVLEAYYDDIEEAEEVGYTRVAFYRPCGCGGGAW